MRFKKTVSAVLAAALTASSVSICAFAEEDQTMKTEMTYVKERMDIPENCTDFNYSTGTDNNKTSYRFTWNDPSEEIDYTEIGKVTSLNVSITGKVIKSIYINRISDYNWQASFAKLSDKAILDKAVAYIKEINPTILSQTKIDEDSLKISLFGEEATLSFHREVNGVSVTGQTGRIVINKNTGELINYRYNWINGASFSDSKGAISLVEAKNAYKKLFDSDLIYTLEYDWKEKKYIPHLTYQQNSFGQINAFSGKLSTFEDYNAYTTEDDVADNEAAEANPTTGFKNDNGARVVTFSPEEIAKLEKENTLIKAEDALKKLAKYDFLLIPESSEISWQSCSYNEMQGYYVRNVTFTAKVKDYYDLNKEPPVLLDDLNYYNIDDTVSGRFSINAETGELLSYSGFSYDNGSNLSSVKAKETANKAIKTILGNNKEKFEDLSESYKNTRYAEYDRKTGAGIGNPITTSIAYSASRQENGIKCINENLSISIDNNGYVSSFRVNFNKNVTYPEPNKIISKNQAYNSFFKNVDFGLRYRCAYRSEDKKVVSALVYAANSTLCIDAFTGKSVNSDGSAIYVDETGNYTDLENSKYKAYAEKLANYGIKLIDKEGKLNENEVITAGDFISLLNAIGYNYYDESKTITEDRKLSRQVAAMIIVKARYGSDIAEMTSLFKNKFKDVKDDSKYLGYIMISDAAGFIKGNSSGKFNPNIAFTRGRAIKLIYDILSKN